MNARRFLETLSTERLMVAILLLSIFFMASRQITDPDFWWHLRTGQYICETRSVPRQDVFSYTVADHQWITHEWLTEVLLYIVYELSGQQGSILLFAALITGTFAVVYLQCVGRPYLASLVVVCAAITSAVTWGVRPQMISLLLSAIFLFMLHLYKEGHRRIIWLMPPLMVLWVNLHGSFLLGLVLPGIYVVGEAVANLTTGDLRNGLRWRETRTLLIVTIVTAIATVANPNGARLLLYPFGTLGSSAMQAYISEWFSPDFHQIAFQPLALLILGTVVTMALSRRTPTATELLFLVGFGWAALRSARFVPYFALVAAPILTAQVADVWQRSPWSAAFVAPRRRGSRFAALNWLLLSIVLLGGVVRVDVVLQNNAEAQRDAFPVEAVDFLMDKGITGHMYNLYHWGGYLVWRLFPREKVFIDGRADVYGDAFIDEYLQVYQLREGWREVLDRYEVTLVIIDEGSSLSTVLNESADWQRRYVDKRAAIFVRREDDQL